MHRAFNVEKRTPIYKADELRKFCIEAGAKTMFDNVLRCITTSRQGQARQNTNQKVTAGFLLELFFRGAKPIVM